jgi:uncharacterized protein (DUF58 family)
VAGAAALGIVLEWYATTSEVPWLFLLAAWMFALVAVAYGYAAWNRAGLRFHLVIKSTRPAAGSPGGDLADHVLRAGPLPAPIFEGDGAEIEVGLDTTGAPRGPAWLSGNLASKDVSFGTGLVPKTGWRRLKVIRELPRGPVDATSWRITSSDPLGFFQSRRGCPDSEVAVVLPRFASLRARHQVHQLEAGVAAPRSGSGTELFGVREFRPGDPLRRIHWRSSARRGELVVREFEPPGVQTLGIFCDPTPVNRGVADQIARIAASEARDCIQDGGRVTLWSPGLEPTAPRQARDLWALLEWLARYGFPDAPSGAFGATSPASGEVAPTRRFAATSPASGEVVAVLGTANPDIVDALDDARRRGARVRAWLVGDAEVELDAAVTRVDTRWPL